MIITHQQQVLFFLLVIIIGLVLLIQIIVRLNISVFLICFIFIVVMCYKMKDTSGWQLMFESEVQSDDIYRLAITARSSSTTQQSQESTNNLRESKLLAIAVRTNVRLWNIVDTTIHTILGTFIFGGLIDNLFFINSQLVATGDERKVGVWHSLSQQWQTQELTRILSFDTVRFII
jgi:hypothetical protein